MQWNIYKMLSRLKIETNSGFLNDYKPKYIELADVT